MLATLDRPLARDQRKLNEQIRMIVDFLTDGLGDEDALATSSRGWRAKNWDPDATGCIRKDCQEDHSPHPRHVGRWQSEIDRSVDRWPRYLALGVPKARNTLEPRDRLIVDGRFRYGLSFRTVAAMVGLTHPTVRVHLDAALTAMARAIWTDEGDPRW